MTALISIKHMAGKMAAELKMPTGQSTPAVWTLPLSDADLKALTHQIREAMEERDLHLERQKGDRYWSGDATMSVTLSVNAKDSREANEKVQEAAVDWANEHEADFVSISEVWEGI